MDQHATDRIPVLRCRVRPPAASGLRRVRLLDPVATAAGRPPRARGRPSRLRQDDPARTHVAERVGRLAWVTLDQDLATPAVLLAHLAAAFAAVPELTGAELDVRRDLLNILETRRRRSVFC